MRSIFQVCTVLRNLIIISMLVAFRRSCFLSAKLASWLNRQQLVKHAAGKGSRQKEHGRTLLFVECEVAVSRLG